MKKIKLQYIIAPIFLLVVCTLTMICAAYNQEMLIDGEAHVRIHKDVRIMSIERYSTTNGGYSTYNPKYSEISTVTYDTLPNLNSTVTYKVKLRNNTNYYINVYDVTSSASNSITNDNFTYEFDKTSLNSTYGSDLLSPNSESFIYITIKYKSDISLPEDTTNIATLKFSFKPIYAYELSYSNSTYTLCTNVQCALDDVSSIINTGTSIQPTYLITYNYNLPAPITVNRKKVIDTGFIPNTNYDFVLSSVANIPTSGKRYLFFGNYGTDPSINLEVNTNTRARIYIQNDTNISRSASVDILPEQDFNVVFNYTAENYYYDYSASNDNFNSRLTGQAAIIKFMQFNTSVKVGTDYRTGTTFTTEYVVKAINIQREYPYGSYLTDLPVVTVPGYTFSGWYTAPTGGTQISTSAKVYSNNTYYAHYTTS